MSSKKLCVPAEGNNYKGQARVHGKSRRWGALNSKEFIPGDFVKFVNNNGIVCEEDTMPCRKV